MNWSDDRLDALSDKVDETNHRVEETNRRIDETNRRIERVDDKVDALRSEMYAELRGLRSQIGLLQATTVGGFVSLVAALVATSA